MMAKLSLWRNYKTNDYKMIDSISREAYHVGSVSVFVHKYDGILEQDDDNNPTKPDDASGPDSNETAIQDVLWMENRNRRYEKNVYELRGYFTESDNDFDLLQFNLGIANGTRVMTFHLNEMIEILGRKLMSGDVLELTNFRDDALLDAEERAVNRWFSVEDASYPTDGFSPLWWPHLWRVKAKPLVDAPEYHDITRNEEGQHDPLMDLISTYDRDIEINDAVEEKASQDVPKRNFDTSHLYVVPGEEFGSQYPWIFAGDGKPPNGAQLTTTTDQGFPDNPSNGDYVLRTDYEPSQLFVRQNGAWRFVEIDWRKTWSQADRKLETYINNDNQDQIAGEDVVERQPISKAVKPKKDI